MNVYDPAAPTGSPGSTQAASGIPGQVPPDGATRAHNGAGATADDRSIGDIFSAVSQDVSTLLHQELELAKAELRQSATSAGAGAGMLAGAGVAGHMVLVFVSIAGWWALAQPIGPVWSALVIALVWAVVAAVLSSMGRARLRQVKGLPRTAETAKHIRDALAGKEPRP